MRSWQGLSQFGVHISVTLVDLMVLPAHSFWAWILLVKILMICGRKFSLSSFSFWDSWERLEALDQICNGVVHRGSVQILWGKWGEIGRTRGISWITHCCCQMWRCLEFIHPTWSTSGRIVQSYMGHMLDISWVPDLYLPLLHHKYLWDKLETLVNGLDFGWHCGNNEPPMQ